MDKKSIGILVGMLLIIATTLQVAGTEKEVLNKDVKSNTHDLMQPGGLEKIPIDMADIIEHCVPLSHQGSRDNYPIPDFEFLKEPTTIMTSWYDYMPGSYAGHPIRLQNDYGNGQYHPNHVQLHTASYAMV